MKREKGFIQHHFPTKNGKRGLSRTIKNGAGFIHAPKNGAGFTLIEVLLVVIILGVLAAIVLPRFIVGTSDAKSKACRTNIHNINTQWELKNIKTGDYGTLTALLDDTAYFPDGPPTCPFEVDYADSDGNQRVDYSGTHDQHAGW